MKIDVSVILKDLDGEEIKMQKLVGEKIELISIRLKDACKDSLMGTYEDEKHLTGSEKFDRFQLASKIALADKECDLTAEEISKIKLLVGKAYGPVVVGPVYNALESKLVAV